ncbi:ATP-binding cassette domain-containing protein [Geoglobus acetivorans]|uniref:ABC transporter, ATP-binding protein n=1 Tax=Geoglobus acetivorans TaxID=565033 RepID=A0A0A7GEJ8_GEOAI|nr:ABC transporter, ATP-binding protein [Geoglobus acetivorans]
MYPSGQKGLEGVRGRIEESCFISGATGKGKSTLLRTFNGLIPDFYAGVFRGKVRVLGEKPSAKIAYLVMQNPYEQITSLRVIDELVFPSVQGGANYRDAKKDAESLAEEMGIGHLLERTTHTLSTGELQIVEILSAILSKKKVLLMDEPFAHLSTRNVRGLIKIIGDLFTIISDHRVEFRELFPQHMDLGVDRVDYPDVQAEIGDVIFDGLLTLKKGEIIAVIGDNGSGKTTMLKKLAEEMKKAKVDFGIVLQNPNYHLTEGTVIQEVGDEWVLRDFGLEGLKDRHPHALSYGQAKRVSIARVFRRDILLLDEPTAGQDTSFRRKLIHLLRGYGKTAVIATHDERLAKCCDRVVRL